MNIINAGKKLPCLLNTTHNPRPTVLIFDSGVGGLSIYNEIRRLLPNLHYIYTFDNVAFPYGEKSNSFIIKRIIQIISVIQQHYPLSLAVIACNTASTISLLILRKKFRFPIVGVMPAIKLAARTTVSGIIGLLATSSTVKHSHTHQLINRFARQYRIETLDSAELVKIVEAKLHGKIISLDKIQCIFHQWLEMPEPPDTIVLGCTHFQLLKNELLQILPKGTRLVDSGNAVARRTAWILKHKAVDAESTDPNLAFCMSITKDVKNLLPALRYYGFKTLKKLLV